MAGSKSYALAFNELKKRPKVAYADIKKLADRRGLKMAPVIYGRAKLALGLSKPGGSKGKAKTAVKGKARRGRPPGSKNKTGARKGKPGRKGKSASAGSLDALVDKLRRSEALEHALDKIKSILGGLR